MLIGAHVRAGGRLVPALERAHEIGADVVQVFTQSPRAWKPTQYAPDVLEAYRSAQTAGRCRATYCHATYLINLATPDDALYGRSLDCLVANLSAARGMGASGLVVHAGSRRGAPAATSAARVAAAVCRALERARSPLGRGDDDPARCPVLLENTAGAGDTVGRTFEELAAIVEAAGAGDALGVCIDTQHLWASGVSYATLAEAGAVVAELDAVVGLGRLGCLHLNDSKVPLGANRDRHENPGHGSIGARALGSLLGHPALQRLPAVMEVPGHDGHGPGVAEVEAARRIVANGRRRWRRSEVTRP